MSEIKLKPCPFCGGEAEYIERGNQYIGIKETVVKCKKCYTKQVHKWFNMKFEFEHIRQLTIDKWNTRKPMEQEIRNKAIDEFAEKLEDSLINNYRHLLRTDTDGFDWLTTDAVDTHIYKIAEQMKEGAE